MKLAKKHATRLATLINRLRCSDPIIRRLIDESNPSVDGFIKERCAVYIELRDVYGIELPGAANYLIDSKEQGII